MPSRPWGEHPLPPLNALRAFEAVARHGSFTRAAEELCVTQTAVSHQVRSLEEALGMQLFRRLPRQVELTSNGRAWASALGEAFSRLYDAHKRLRTTASVARPTVSVSIIPSFGSRWLVPRLGRFLDEQPNVDMRISPSAELVDFSSTDIDLGIRYGSGHYPGLQVEHLYADSWVVVCSPLLRQRASLKSVHDLGRFVLLRDDAQDAWRSWLQARGVRNLDPDRGPLLTDSSMVVEAAVQGQGVALVRLALAADDLAAGRLVRPFPRVRPLPTGLAYYLVAGRSAAVRPEVAAFRAWVLREIAALPTT